MPSICFVNVYSFNKINPFEGAHKVLHTFSSFFENNSCSFFLFRLSLKQPWNSRIKFFFDWLQIIL